MCLEAFSKGEHPFTLHMNLPIQTDRQADHQSFCPNFVDELLEGRLLFGAALENEHDAAERCGVGQGTLVELGACQRMGIANESSEPRLVDRLKNAGPRRTDSAEAK